MRVFAVITPKPEHVDDAVQAVQSIVERTLAEPGCHRFDLFVSPEGGKLFLDEEWTDADALAFHHEQSYTREVFAAYESWLLEPPVLYELAEPGTPSEGA